MRVSPLATRPASTSEGQGPALHVLVEAGEKGVLFRLLEQAVGRQAIRQAPGQGRLAGPDGPLHHDVARLVEHGRTLRIGRRNIPRRGPAEGNRPYSRDRKSVVEGKSVDLGGR